MKNDTLQNNGRVEAIGDEAVYLRINQLQKGLLQFTDSCCPAKPDSLEFCKAKLHIINSWSLHLCKLPNQTAWPFGRTAGQRVWRGYPVHRPLEKMGRLGRYPLAGRHRRIALHQAA